MRISDWSSDVCSSDLGEIDVVNTDPVLHNTHGFYGRPTAFNLELPNQGQRIKADLTRPGLVRVECDAHGWMPAWIYVDGRPSYALNGQGGSSTLNEPPPGDDTQRGRQGNGEETESNGTIKT